MSSSSNREEMAAGVGESAERVRRMLPCSLMNLRRLLGLREGPRPGLLLVNGCSGRVKGEEEVYPWILEGGG